jgi:hypothetical protein
VTSDARQDLSMTKSALRERPWWRDWRGTPPETKLDRELAKVPPLAAFALGAWLWFGAVVTILLPEAAPPFLAATGGGLIGVGLRGRLLRRNHIHE